MPRLYEEPKYSKEIVGSAPGAFVGQADPQNFQEFDINSIPTERPSSLFVNSVGAIGFLASVYYLITVFFLSLLTFVNIIVGFMVYARGQGNGTLMLAGVLLTFLVSNIAGMRALDRWRSNYKTNLFTKFVALTGPFYGLITFLIVSKTA